MEKEFQLFSTYVTTWRDRRWTAWRDLLVPKNILTLTIIRDNLTPEALKMLFALIYFFFLQLHNICLFSKALNSLLHVFHIDVK